MAGALCARSREPLDAEGESSDVVAFTWPMIDASLDGSIVCRDGLLDGSHLYDSCISSADETG